MMTVETGNQLGRSAGSTQESPQSNGVVNVSWLIDNAAFTWRHGLVVMLCALVSLLDGADSQVIGIAARSIMGSLDIHAQAFGIVFSITHLGAALGALTIGSLGDRWGRKSTLLIALLILGVFSIATAWADSLTSLTVLRFLAGIGIGGATPCFLSMVSDYAPLRRRGTLVAVAWSFFPLGGMLGGLLNSAMLARWGWQSVFLVGGGIPICIALVLFVLVPETVQHLAAKGAAPSLIRARLKWLGISVPPSVERFVCDERKRRHGSIREVFGDHRKASTFVLWAILAVSFATLSLVVTWTPILIHDKGIGDRAVPAILAGFNAGCFVGMGAAGYLVDRFGPLRTLFVPFILAACAVASLPAAGSVAGAAAAATVLGLTCGMGCAGAIAVMTLLYPIDIRATGIGFGMASTRTGQVVAPLVISLLISSGFGSEHLFFAMAMFPASAALFVVVFCLIDRKRVIHANASALA
ncbi:MAG TPA: MFS transporter [Bordetella sp.]